MSVAAPAVPSSPASEAPIRVMVVDDASVVRGLMCRWLNAEPDLRVVSSLRTGQDAVDRIESVDPDIVVMDVEMPVLDGLSALPLLLQKKRDLVVIMASTRTRRNSETSLKALSLGATDYIQKPESGRDLAGATAFRQDLIERIRQYGMQRRRAAALAPPAQRLGTGRGARPSASLPIRHGAPASAPIALRPFSIMRPQALLIGASTGGPHALATVLGGLGRVIDSVPVLITQHMPPTFTQILADHLARTSRRVAREAREGEVIATGTLYLAPGGRHMRVARVGGAAVIALDDGPPVNYCKPSIDPLFASAATVWGSASLAVILTGMGVDGTSGAGHIVARGGSVIAQDEATSVVWGMPGSAAHAGYCSALLPLDRIAPTIVELLFGDRP